MHAFPPRRSTVHGLRRPRLDFEIACVRALGQDDVKAERRFTAARLRS